jgi:hypothetical protein
MAANSLDVRLGMWRQGSRRSRNEWRRRTESADCGAARGGCHGDTDEFPHLFSFDIGSHIGARGTTNRVSQPASYKLSDGITLAVSFEITNAATHGVADVFADCCTHGISLAGADGSSDNSSTLGCANSATVLVTAGDWRNEATFSGTDFCSDAAALDPT